MIEPARKDEYGHTTTSAEARRRLAAVTDVFSLAAVAIGIIVVAIRLAGVADLPRFVPHSLLPPPRSAVGLILAGSALWFLRGDTPQRRWHGRVGRLLAVGTVVMGLTSLIATFTEVPVGVDRLLPPASVSESAPGPMGRPVPGTALSLIAIGLALLLLDVETRRGRRPSQYLALVPAFFGFEALAGLGFADYHISGPGLGPQPVLAAVSLPIAVGFILLSVGILASRPDAGFIALFTRSDSGGYIARRLLPVAILAPIAAEWISGAGERAGLFGVSFGTTLVVMTIIVIFTFVVAKNASSLTRLDARRRETEIRLRESEAQFRLIFEEAGTGIGVVDSGGRLIALNPALQRFMGRSAAELEGTHFVDLTHPEDVARDVSQFERLLRGECQHYQIEKRFIRGDGATVWGRLTASMIRDEHGDPRCAVGLVDDITEQKRYDEHRGFLLEASRVLAASLEVDSVINDLLGLVVPRMADAASVDLLEEMGVTRRYRVGRAVPARREIVDRLVRLPPPGEPPADLPNVVRSAEPALFQELTDELFVRVSRSEQELELLRTLQPTTAIVTPLRARGRVIGTLTLARTKPARAYEDRDMITAVALSDRAALAIDNARLHRDAHRATQVRDEVLRIVAHDLRNPLNSITLALGVLRSRSLRPGDMEADRYASMIDKAVGRAVRLIDDLLDVARIAAGRLSLQCRPVDPAGLARDAIEVQRPAAEEKSLSLELDAPDGLPEIYGDHDRLNQVLTNLIDNAIKFTPAGGRVRVRLRHVGGAVGFQVRDTGPGISPEDMENLFTPFWQARKKRSDGTGLGLSIAAGIVAAHGSRIGVRCKAGEGSTFSFAIGLAEKAGARSDERQDAREEPRTDAIHDAREDGGRRRYQDERDAAREDLAARQPSRRRGA